MKRISVLLLGTALATAMLVPAPPTTAATAADRVTVGSLALGLAPRVDYLSGRVLHTADGRTVTVRVPRRFQDSLELLGRRGHGWVMGNHHASTLVQVGATGRVRTLGRLHRPVEGRVLLTLSTDRRSVVSWWADESGAAHLRVLDLATGRTVARHAFGSGGQVLAVHGRTVWFARWRANDQRGPLVTWTPGHRPVPTGARGVTVLDLAGRQVMRTVLSPEYGEGLASLEHPRSVRWSVCTTCRPTYASVAFSPDGSRLLGDLGLHRVVVRDTAAGAVQVLVRFDARVYATRWEGSRHVLVEVLRPHSGRADQQHALVRCGSDGRCARVSAWQPHSLLRYDGP